MQAVWSDRLAVQRFDHFTSIAQGQSAFLRNGFFLTAYYGRGKVYSQGDSSG